MRVLTRLVVCERSRGGPVRLTQGGAEAEQVAVGIHVGAFAEPVVGVDRRDESTRGVGGAPLGIQGVRVVDVQELADPRGVARLE